MDIIELLNVKIKNADYTEEDIISLKKEDIKRILYALEKQVEEKPIEEKQPEKPVYESGQKVRVVSDNNNHEFSLNSVILLIERAYDGWFAVGGGKKRYIDTSEIKPID